MLSSYEIIFFDAGGTLFHPYPSVGAIYSEVALRHGCPVEPERIERIFREAWLKRDGMAALTNHSSEKIEKEWWSSLVFEVFSQVGGVPAFELFFEELYDVFARPSVWRLYGGALEVLGHLKKKGKRLGIVSNWDSRLFGLVSGLGLDAYFEFVLASAVVGFSKPNPKIFNEALKRMGAAPGEAIHIGDSMEDDIRGAANAGMSAVLIDRHGGEHREIPAHVRVIRDLRELVD